MAGRFGRALEAVVAALVAEILEDNTVALSLGGPQLDPVQVHIAADHGGGDGDGLLLQAEKGLHFLHAPVAFFCRDHPDHLENVGLQADGAHLGHHGGGDGLVTGQGAELIHLVFQQEGVLAAALQQGGGSAFRQGWCPAP